MKKLVVRGGIPLKGDVFISGSKNAAVGILPAVILAEDVCTLENVPDVSDVRILLDVLESLGAKYEWKDNNVTIDPKGINSYIALDDIIQRLRGSSYLIGALLGRFGNAEVAMPGGCNLGPRPIDQHIKGFKAMGAVIRNDYGKVVACAPDGLFGADIYMDVVSVGATINLMLAAVKAEGTTIIENCAREPHVVDVANFLNMIGANVRGAGTSVIKIKGVKHLGGNVTYSIIPDQIEAGTFMVAAAATHGDVNVKNIIPKHMEALTAKLREMNVGVTEYADSIRVYYKGDIIAADVKTMPYPGFPTDLQPQITALLSIADGDSMVSEGVWASRFQYVGDLCRMGADIRVSDKSAIIQGGRKLKGTSVKCTDLRAGAAYVIAALAAEGETNIYEVRYIDRGYCQIEEKLRSLRANIERIDAPDDLI